MGLGMSTTSLSLYKISDAVQIPVIVKSGLVHGERNAIFKVMRGVEMELSMTAQNMFKGEQVGVLFHIAGDLHALVAHYAKTGTVSLFLLDGSKTGAVKLKNLVDPAGDLRTTVEEFGPAVVRSFHWTGERWKPLKLPS